MEAWATVIEMWSPPHVPAGNGDGTDGISHATLLTIAMIHSPRTSLPHNLNHNFPLARLRIELEEHDLLPRPQQ